MIKLIGISGKARAGKDTVCDMMIKELDNSLRYAMADPIKASLFGMLGITTMTEQTNLMQAKEEPIPWLGHSPRALLQEIGGGLRESLSRDIWIRFLERFCEEFVAMESLYINKDDHPPIYVIVPDIRYNNEAEYIKENDGIIIRVNNPTCPAVRKHSSEAGVSIRYVDHIIDNDGTLEELEEKVKQLLKEGDFE